MIKLSLHVENRQKQLVDKYVELINYQIEKGASKGQTLLTGMVMENAVRKIVQKHFEKKDVNVEKCVVLGKNGKFVEYDIVIYRGEKEALLVNPSDIVAVVEVKSFADATGYKKFQESLSQCGINPERGYFFGITGSIRGLSNGVDLNSKSRIFILAKYSYSNIKKKQKMQRDKVKDNLNVLEQFLKTLSYEIEKSFTCAHTC